MPTIQLGNCTVSRLIIGGNQMAGYSHVTALMTQQMVEWYTPERTVEVLKRCLAAGINTWQISIGKITTDSLELLRKGGDDIQWICLTDTGGLPDTDKVKELIQQLKPIAIVHHGGTSDGLWREGKINVARDFIKRVKDNGVLGGLSAHNPDVIKNAEDSGWELDLYMTCFHRQTRTYDELKKLLGQVPLGEVYLPDDPAAMCSVVRQVKRPCLGFKILAAGRRCENPGDVREAFKFALTNIKPIDGVIVGMYPRYQDEIAENVALVKEFTARGR
jgi:hypothetical protein